DQVISFAEETKNTESIHALSLTDNAGGNPALSADVLAAEIQALGIDVIAHFTCKDMNRNYIESRAYALRRSGVQNLLVLTGDYPVSGYLGTAKPVFDVDSVSALHYLSAMNKGLEMAAGKKTAVIDPPEFYLGACVSPFKWTEGPCKMQYLKMEKKIQAGAHYFITQLGYDARKYIELIRFARDYLKIRLPIIGSVYLLTRGAARLMNAGEIPGSYVTVSFMKKVAEEAEAPDKGRGARIDRAAKQVALLKGLGYSGAHIEGLNLNIADVENILSKAEEYGADWETFIGEFDCVPSKPFYLFSNERNDGEPAFTRTRRKVVLSPVFWLTRMLHFTIFEPGTLGCKFMTWFTRVIENRKVPYAVFGWMERVAKKLLFDCRQCDDCALFELFYLCPESKCPKGMREGPCGGSRVDGSCEVHEENRCVWDLIYTRAKNRRQCDTLRFIIAPRDWSLYQTNSWVNYFQKHDHSSRELDVGAPGAKSVCDA
ncbi:MAG: methylenetetrahydrofolate reductase C-terminal domain-containing protein, partial [Spirochaetales bacterium]|nr:methylenetetrahydrofolate reductase C-terminal domain-containing protein [Spirochaetales bacterium]